MQHDSAQTPQRSSPAQWGSLRRGMSLNFLGNVVYAGCQLATMVLLVRFCSAEMVGQFALGLAVTAPVMMFAALQLRTIISTDQCGEFRFRQYFASRLAMTVTSLIAVAGIAAAAGYDRSTTLVILAVALAKAIELIGELFHGLFQRHEWMGRIAVSLIAKGVLSVVAVGVAVAWSGRLIPGVLAMAVAWLVVLVAFDVPQGLLLLRRKSAGKAMKSTPKSPGRVADLRAAARLIVIGTPLGLVLALNSLSLNIPRYFLESMQGERALGIFAALAVFMRFGFYFEIAMGRSALPRLARLHAEGYSRRFGRTLLKLLAAVAVIGLVGVLGSLLLGKPLLRLVYAEEYAVHAPALHVLMIAAGLGYVAGMLKVAVDATRTFVAQLPLFLAATAVSALAAWWLVPAYGIIGAAAALVVAKLVLIAGYGAMLLHIAPHRTLAPDALSRLDPQKSR